MNKPLGILGGTFDPPHLAHLVLAEQARAQLGLERVLFCPVGQQPLKADYSVTPVEHRLAMVQLAIAGQPHFELSLVDVNRPGPHYTGDMLALLHANYANTDFNFIVGTDSLRDFLRWRDPARIISLARLAVARRPGSQPDMAELDAALPGLRERLVWLDTPWLDISATDIRRRVRLGLPIRYLVPLPVEAYIEQHELYTQPWHPGN